MKLLEQAVANIVARHLTPQTVTIALAASEAAEQWAKGQALAEKARLAIENAVAEATHHVELVRANNLGKSMAEVLARDDVQEALRIPFTEAEQAIADAVRTAWATGADRGWSNAVDELNAIGITAGARPELDERTLNSILQDVHNNAVDARTRFEGAFTSPDTQRQVEKVGKDLAIRAQLSVDAAGQASLNEMKNAAFSEHEGVQKMWVAHIDERTCKWCRWLHGQVVPLGEPFPTPAGSPAIYGGGPLYFPPRHPRCRCAIHPHLGDKVDVTKVQAGGLVSGATNDAPPPPSISAEALRSIPKGKVKTVLAWLKRWLTRGTGS